MRILILTSLSSSLIRFRGTLIKAMIAGMGYTALRLAFLENTLDEVLHTILYGYGHNIRMTLTHLRALWAEILADFLYAFGTKDGANEYECRSKALAA